MEIVHDNNFFSAAILVDLSKVLDTINHDLLIAKFCPYGIKENFLRLLRNYFNNRYQRIKID